MLRIALLTLIMVSGAVIGKEAISKPPEIVLSEPSKSISQAEAELLVLRDQNKIIKEFQGALLSTVTWALGGVFGLTFLLAGLGWWSNFKLYESDKKKLQADFERLLSETETKFTLQVDGVKSDSDKSMEVRYNLYLDRLLSELSDVRANIINTRSELLEDIKLADAKLVGLDERSSGLKRQIIRANAEIRYVEEFVWDLKGVVSNMVLAQSQALESAIELADEFSIDLVLDRIIRTIKNKLVGEDLHLSKYAFDRVESALKISQKTNSLKSLEALDLLKSVNIKDV